MNTLLLPIALLLPWLAGAMALRPLRQRLGLTPAGWLGYGYFLGAALLTVSAFLAALIPPLATAAGLILCLAALSLATGFGAKRLARLLPAATPLALPPATRREHWLTALLLALIGLHLGFAAFELYWRPVYPWDAWQTWAYTAKAWYYNGSPVDMLHPHQWLNLPDNGTYTVQGHHYPWLVPVQSWWLAKVLGAWQEKQVLWPALPAAIALGLALWGQAVAATRQRLAGPLAAWLLLSLPLVTTHIALAGYADLWLAGFSGLGLIALVRGLLEAHRGQLLLGLAAMALGLLVKHDAVIWLACALLLIGLLGLRQTTTAAVTLAAALIVAALTFGFSRIQLQLNADITRYGQFLWLADSWHLLWYLLPGTLLLALLPGSPARTTAKALGLLLTILLTSQLLLFGFTNAGNWVGTAASRLLLHISPLLIFALACIVGASAGSASIGHWRRSAVAILAGSLCLLLLSGAWLLSSSGAAHKPAAAADFKAPQLRVIYGPLIHRHNHLMLSPATDGRAIVSTGPTQFDAATFDLLKVDIEGTGQSIQTLFWRTAANPADGFFRDLVIGSGQIILSEDDNWQGEIIEVGMLLHPNPERTVILRGLHFKAATPQALLRLAAANWITPSYWTQASINYTRLGTTTSLPSLPLVAGLWVLLCWLALRLLPGAAMPLRPLLGVALFAWLLLDARWLHNNYHQALATQAHYAKTTDGEALDIGDDAAILALARQARASLGEDPRRVLLIAKGKHHQFALRRLKYALLPHAAHTHHSRASRQQAASVDAIIWLSDDEPGMQANCPEPLQDTQPVLVTSHGILCVPSPQSEIKDD